MLIGCVLHVIRRQIMEEQWIPAGSHIPCPVCGSVKWCLIHRGGRKVICPKTPSAEHYLSKAGEKNYIHRITGEQAKKVKLLVDKVPVYTHRGIDFERIMNRLDGLTTWTHLMSLCQSLGPHFRPGYVDMYGVCWDGKSWYMPMENGAAKLTGIQRRFPDGGKRFVKESRGGVFVPSGPVESTVYFLEGFTDTLASYTAGYYSVGRVSAKTCYEEAVRFVKTNKHIDEVHIIADYDQPDKYGVRAGLAGATTLQTILSGIKRLNVCDILRPIGDYNDVRSMFNVEASVTYERYIV